MTRSPIKFIPFDERGECRVYYNGFLPHWRQAGCTYFVTFRLADSVPQNVVEQWRYEREKWLNVRGITTESADEMMSQWRRLSPEERRIFERLFAGRLFSYLDRRRGQCLLRNSEVRSVVTKAMLHFDEERVETGDFVVMPNHIHALLTPLERFELENILHSIKSFTANQINSIVGRSGTVWMDESYDHIVRDAEELLRIQEYVRQNPGKAGLRGDEYEYRAAEYFFSG